MLGIGHVADAASIRLGESCRVTARKHVEQE